MFIKKFPLYLTAIGIYSTGIGMLAYHELLYTNPVVHITPFGDNSDKIKVQIVNEAGNYGIGHLIENKYNTECLKTKGFYLNEYDTQTRFNHNFGPEIVFGCCTTDPMFVDQILEKFKTSCDECNMMSEVEYIDLYGFKKKKVLKWQ